MKVFKYVIQSGDWKRLPEPNPNNLEIASVLALVWASTREEADATLVTQLVATGSRGVVASFISQVATVTVHELLDGQPKLLGAAI